MLKKSLTDGLVQLAIVLSLLRTDLVDNYLNSYYNRYPEIQEIVLGTSSAYTQTHFHNRNWQDRYGVTVHQKSVDSYHLSDVFRELRALGSSARFRRVETDVMTWLISNPPTPLVSDTASEVTVVPGVSVGSGGSIAEEQQGASGSSAPQEITSEISLDSPFNSYLGEELTKEDIDLIEVLWRQDMDLGVGREMFDANLRRELEKEQELELQKKREKEQELELLQAKLLAEEEAAKATEVSTNYIVDNETGELIPAPMVPSSMPEPGTDLSSRLDDSDEGLSVEEAMRILEEQEAEPVSPLAAVMASTSPVLNSTDNQHNTSILLFDSGQEQIQQNYQRQNSFEQRWQDIATVLNLPPATGVLGSLVSNNFSFPENSALQNTTPNYPTANIDLHNDTSVLQSNVSLAAPAELNSGLTTPSGNGSLFDLDSQEFMFPADNASSGHAPQADTYNQSSALLQELLDESDITSLELPEFVDGLHMRMIDEASSDSALSSMDSMASQVQDDAASMSSLIGSTGMPANFDGIEGASGGDYDSPCNKYVKYEKFDTDQNDDGMYSDFSFPEDVLLNQSVSSNESDTSYKTAELRHVNHNHTYPLQPGQPPKEPYHKPKKESKNRGKSRDEVRAKVLKIPLTIDQIIDTAVEEFNDLLQKYTLSEQQLQLVRDIRRRGKNKVAAQNCRKRKLDVLTTLEDEVDAMAAERNKLLKEHGQLEQEMSDMRGKFQQLYQEVFQSLRDEHGQPYDPALYSLQQSSDGNVFLVPRNSTSANNNSSNNNSMTEAVPKEKATKKKSVKK